MTAHLCYYVAAWLLVTALYGVATSRNLVHLIGCLGVVQAASYLVLLSIGFRWPPAQRQFIRRFSWPPTNCRWSIRSSKR